MAFLDLCSTISSDSVLSVIVTVRVSNSSIWKGSGWGAMRTWGVFSSLTKMTTVQSDVVDRSTDSLETEAVELSPKLSGKESLLHVPGIAFSYTAGARAPALSFVVSLRAVLCLAGLKCSAHSFMMISATFGILSADNEVINSINGSEWHGSLRNRVLLSV